MEGRKLGELLEAAKAAGARGAEVLHRHDTVHELSVVRGRVQGAQSQHASLVVAVWLEGGRRASQQGAPEAFDALLAAAIGAAAEAPEDTHTGPVARQDGLVAGLGLLDRRYEALTREDRDDVLSTAERGVRQLDRRLVPGGFTYRDAFTVRRFANSRGVLLSETETTYEVEGTVSAVVDGAEVSISERLASRTFASVASLPFGTSACRRVLDLVQPLVDVVGPVRVLLPPLPVARLFATLAERFFAANVGDDGSYFLNTGGATLDSRLHLQDDGTLPGGLRSRSFDDRGVRPVALTLLREGRVDGRFINPETAHRFDVRPTGHVVGSTQRPSNLLLRSGTRSMNATLADLGGRVLIVDDLPDLSGLDPATGDLVATVSGVVHDNNKPVGAFRNLELRGNLRSILTSVVEVCGDTDRIGHVDAPGMIVDGFTAA